MIFSGSCFSVVFLFRSCHRTGASDDGFHDGRTIIRLGCQFRFWTSNGKSTWKLNVAWHGMAWHLSHPKRATEVNNTGALRPLY
ncbi:unnamed protein product, partial [Musa hybrid cultivar]